MPKLKSYTTTNEEDMFIQKNIYEPQMFKGITDDITKSIERNKQLRKETEELKKKRLEMEALESKKVKKPKEEKDKFTKFLSSNKRSHDEIEKWLLKNHYDPSKDTDLHKKQDERTKLIKMRDDAKTILHIIEIEESKM
jgi:hypothetical protein